MKSDNIFLRCLDMGGIEVYEVDSPYIYPVKGKHWSHLGISIGSGKQYEVLQIGKKQIKDADLHTLIKYLFNSRLVVNREGLCFLATTGVTAVLLEVHYYRYRQIFKYFLFSFVLDIYFCTIFNQFFESLISLVVFK